MGSRKVVRVSTRLAATVGTAGALALLAAAGLLTHPQAVQAFVGQVVADVIPASTPNPAIEGIPAIVEVPAVGAPVVEVTPDPAAAPALPAPVVAAPTPTVTVTDHPTQIGPDGRAVAPPAPGSNPITDGHLPDQTPAQVAALNPTPAPTPTPAAPAPTAASPPPPPAAPPAKV